MNGEISELKNKRGSDEGKSIKGSSVKDDKEGERTTKTFRESQAEEKIAKVKRQASRKTSEEKRSDAKGSESKETNGKPPKTFGEYRVGLRKLLVSDGDCEKGSHNSDKIDFSERLRNKKDIQEREFSTKDVRSKNVRDSKYKESKQNSKIKHSSATSRSGTISKSVAKGTTTSEVEKLFFHTRCTELDQCHRQSLHIVQMRRKTLKM